MFLFQIGAIKTLYDRIFHGHITQQFLFQIGAIKTIYLSFCLLSQALFLFQIGAIKTIAYTHLSSIFFRVSIPDWCD